MERARGFTLFELVAVTAVVGLLLSLSLLFVHPKDYSAQNRNAQRWVDVAHLMQAFTHYAADHGGLPTDITTKAQVIGTQKDELNLCTVFVPAYMKDVPLDPEAGAELSPTSHTCLGAAGTTFYSTGYSIRRTDTNVVEIAAPSAELGVNISLSRAF